MKSEFSEFSYGFAITHGLLLNDPNVVKAPYLPSLIEEGSSGIDVKLDYPGHALFLQFKLSDHLVRSNALYWEYYNDPYFRIEVTPSRISEQHNLLRQLAETGEEVYYVAPLFYTISEFDQAFRRNQVSEQSIWIPLIDLPDITDDEPHHVTFVGKCNPSWHTEKGNLEGKLIEGEFSWQRTQEDIIERFERNELLDIDNDYLYELRNKLLRVRDSRIEGYSRSVDRPAETRDVLIEISYLLTTFYGLEMVVLRRA